MIPYGRHHIEQSDIDAVTKVLKEEMLTQGNQVPQFENEIARLCDAKHAIALNSATSALHIACLSIGIGKGDIVWTSAITFVASANAGLYCGAEIDFIDINIDTYNIDPDLLKNKLHLAKAEGKLPKAIIVVHMAGRSCPMKEIKDLAMQFRFQIIEDASHAFGGWYDGLRVGNCKYSDAAIFSFHPVKMATTCEGGVIITNNDDIASNAQRLRTHGIVQNNNVDFIGEPDGRWHYQQISLGYNYRLSDLHAALGRNQISRLDQFIKRRQEIADLYSVLLDHPDIYCPEFSDEQVSSWHLYIVRIKSINSINNKKVLFDTLFREGIGVALHYIPVYHHPFHKKNVTPECTNAEQYYREAVSLPIYYGLSEENQRYVASTLIKALAS
jgi:UDP-4-amino-4,6-dideoxy-N-acetyl-beta-L-altrosamine transaminase